MDIEPLLQPITAESPCGEDLSYDVGFNELETLARGKEAQQFSASDNPEWQVAAEEPDWKVVSQKSLELFGRTRDLRVTVILVLALLKLEGIPGVRDGLALLLRLIRENWEGVYPRLDPGDNNDPTERINIIAGLAKPLGTFGDPLRFIERLRRTPLSNSTQMGRLSLADITQVGLPPGTSATPPTPAQVEAAFRDTSVDELGLLNDAARASQATLTEIDHALMELVGASNAPSFDELGKVLAEIQTTLAPYLPEGASTVPDSASGETPAAGAEGAAGAVPGAKTAFTGAIKSRSDIIRAIDQICEYYRVAEPGNPVPLLLRRAQRLVDKDFMTVMQDLMPDSVSQLGNIVGLKRDAESPAPSEETPPPA